MCIEIIGNAVRYFTILFLFSFIMVFNTILASGADTLSIKISLLNNLETGKLKNLTNDNIDDLISTLLPIKTYSTDISSLIIEKSDSIKYLREFIRQIKKEQVYSSHSIIKDKPSEFMGKEITIEGMITETGNTTQNNLMLTIADVYKCEFDKSQSAEYKKFDLGDKANIKGMAYKIEKYILMKSCRFYYPNPLIEENNQLLTCAKGLLSKSIELLKKEIIIHKNNIALKLITVADSLFSQGEYSNSIYKYQQAKSISEINREFVINRIDSAKKYISFQIANDMLQRENFLAAFEKYDSLSLSNFNNSRQLASLSLRSYFKKEFTKLNNSVSLQEHISLLNELMGDSFSVNYSQVLDSLFDQYKGTLSAKAKRTIIGDLNDYIIIPGGKVILSNSNKSSVSTMAIRKTQVTYNEFLYFLLVSRKSFPNSHKINELKTIYAQEFENWLGVKILSEVEREFIAADGWISVKEQSKFTSWRGNYGLSVTDLSIRLENPAQISNVKEQADNLNEKIVNSITKMKNEAYYSGRVGRWFGLSVAPYVTVNASQIRIEKYDFKVNQITYKSDTSKFVFNMLSGNVGIQFALPGSINSDGEDSLYNGPAINFSYLFNGKTLTNALPNYSYLYIKDIALKGPEVELIYMNRAKTSVTLFNGIISIGVGFAQYTLSTQYGLNTSLKPLKSSLLKADNQKTEKINFATVSTNLGCLFFKAYASMGNKNTYGSTIYGFNAGIKLGLPIRLFVYDL